MNKDKLLVGFLTAIIGLLLLLTPGAFAKFSVILLGGASILNGILILLTARNLIYDLLYNRLVLFRGILSILVGGFAVALPLAFAESVLLILAYTLGGYLLISGAILAFTTLKLKKNGIQIKNSIIEIVISAFLSILLFTILTFISPERMGMTIIYVFGGLLVLLGLILVLIQWISRPTKTISVPPQNAQNHSEPPVPQKESIKEK